MIKGQYESTITARSKRNIPLPVFQDEPKGIVIA
jgi:hypothetical protein